MLLLLTGARVRRTPSSTKSSSKKVKKRNPWSDDESKSESDLEENEPVIIPRDSLLRRAAGTQDFVNGVLLLKVSTTNPHFPLTIAFI